MPHFEIHVSNTKAAQAFYAGLFGCSFAPMGETDVDYHLIEGSDIGLEKGVSGGMLLRAGAAPEAGSGPRGGTMTFDVDDCDASYAWALANGGAEALPPMDYEGIGRCAYVEDGQGNIVGMISPTLKG